MNITLKKFDWIRWTIYLITVLFLAYLIFICFFAKPDQFLFGNVFIKPAPIDFGGFGSLLAGIFSPLAFLWLVLNFRQQDKNLMIAEQQLEILTQEKENRRNLLRASLIVLGYDVEHYSNDDYKLSANFTFTSNFDLNKAKLVLTENNSAITLKPALTSGPMMLGSKEKYIRKDTEILVRFDIGFNLLNYSTLSILRLHISYLDSDGYPQKNAFSIFLSPKSAPQDIRKNGGFVVMTS